MNELLLLTLFVACISAAYLEARCLRDPCIPDNPLSLAGRRIKIVGYMVLALRFGHILLDGMSVHWVGGGALLLVAFADCIRCANRLKMPRSVMVGAGQ